jgi:hypothetical protein
MEIVKYIPLGIYFFVLIFLSIGFIPDWVKSMKNIYKKLKDKL